MLGHFGVAAGFGKRDHDLRRSVCSGVSARAPVSSSASLATRCRRLAHDLESDVAAHRQAGEREARRRRGQNAPGDRRHAVVAGVVGDHDRPEPPQRRDLLGIEPRRAGQTRE